MKHTVTFVNGADDLATREAALYRREVELAARRDAARQLANAAFVEKLIESGRMLERQRVPALEAMRFLDDRDVVSFGEGVQCTALECAKSIMGSYPSLRMN